MEHRKEKLDHQD